LLIDDFAADHPIIKVIHRTKGAGGKGAALIEATEQATGEILLLFDADYFPGRAMLQMLVSPFCDPEIGAVMGRVVPHNTGGSLLAALLGLERAAGYQVSQQARYNLGLTPQFGGTVGGVRVSALKSVGGWNVKSLTEDTDLTFRMAAHGWRIGYVNRAECYEEAPESWNVRERQIVRWAMGHTDCLHRLGSNILSSRLMTKLEKLDAIFVLCCYFTAPVLVFGWLCSLVLLFSPQAHQVPAFSVALALVGYQLFGSQATFFEMGAAAVLDGKTRPADLVPLNLFNFFASTGAICKALFKYYSDRFFGTPAGWDKTKRFRENGFPNGNGNGNGNGHGNGNGNGNGHPRPRLYTQGANGLYTCGLEEHRP
jgi:cellulose synthase/poly-beta-1,6-N-acetylglucosamine synthase-like glycosyltransferase